MGNANAISRFYSASFKIDVYGDLILYVILTADSAICIIYLLTKDQGWKNYTISILLASLFVYGAVQVAYLSLFISGAHKAPYNLLNSVTFAFAGLINWVIAQSYVKVAYETSQLLDKDVLFNDPVKIEAVARFKSRIKTANLVCPLLVLSFSVCIYFGFELDSFWFYNVGSYGWLALMTIFTLVWGWTL